MIVRHPSLAAARPSLERRDVQVPVDGCDEPAGLLVMHHRGVLETDVDAIVADLARRHGVDALSSAALLPDLVVVDAPGYRCSLVLAHRSWAPLLAGPAATGTGDRTTSATTEADVVQRWCRSRAAQRLTRAVGTAPIGRASLQLPGGIVLGLALASAHARRLAS